VDVDLTSSHGSSKVAHTNAQAASLCMRRVRTVVKPGRTFICGIHGYTRYPFGV